MSPLVVPGGVLERVLDGSVFGCWPVTGDDQPEAIVAVLIPLATTADDEIGHCAVGNAARCCVEDVDQ